ncbi:MAG: UvrD-helicase domain-containing protein [Thermoguttaceae bacterium]|nr:UvrD-helicase domain-containing protein [Thermoguttaceae bacterium]
MTADNKSNDREMKNLIIRASAGTGKTYRLTNRYIRLLVEGVKPEEILAVTFTRKAAGEIFNRVLKRLAEAAGDSLKCRELSGAIYNKDETALTQEKARETLAAFVRNMHRVRISTIDSFFGQMAGSFARELDFPFEWKPTDDESVNTRNRQRAIRESFGGEGDEEADVGKLIYDFYKGETTRSLTREIDEILKRYTGILRESDKDAWFRVPVPDRKELSKLEKDALVDDLRAGLRETIDAARSKYETANLEKKGDELITSFKNDDEAILGNTIFANVVSADKDDKYGSIVLAPSFAAVIRAASESVKLTFLKRLRTETEATYRLISEIDARLEAIKAASGEYGFDDVTFRLSKLHAENREKLLDYRLDSHTKHLLLDEFQDTSLFQWKVLEPLASAAVDGGTPEHTFFCVGDTKQSIYQWRNGVPEIFDHVKEKYCDEKKRAEEEHLDKNYRSAPEIMEAVNAVFDQNNPCRILITNGADRNADGDSVKKGSVSRAAENWYKNFRKHDTAKKDLKGFVSLEEVPPYDAHTPEEWREIFRLPVCAKKSNREKTPDKELRWAYAANRIKKIHDEKPNATIGVLFRSGKTLEALADRLKTLGVEISQEGGNPLSTAASVRAVLALLRVADHPGDSAALARAATVPALLDAVPDEFRPSFVRLAEDREYRAAAGKALSIWARAQIATVGLGAFVRVIADRLLPICNTRESEKLRALIVSAFRFESQRTAETRLDRFVAFTETKGVSLPGDSNVHLLTIHKSKGLEYDVVVLPELDDTLVAGDSKTKVIVRRPAPTDAPDVVFRHRSIEFFPLFDQEFPAAVEAYKKKWQAEANESLNVLYVAMTRAKRELVMIADADNREVDNKTGGKKDFKSQSFQNILRTQLKSKESESPLLPLDYGANPFYQIGDPHWYDNDPEFGAKQAPAAPPRAAVAAAVPCAPRESASARALAPSHKAFHRVWTPSVTERGLIVHACFEQIEWLDAPLTDERFEEIKRAVLAELFAGKPVPNKFGVCLEGFRRLCAEPEVLQSLSPAYYERNYPGLAPRVFRERPYLEPLRGPGRRKGIIDRLVLLMDGEKVAAADIVDYKSDIDVHHGADPAEYVRRAGYDNQLAEYRKYIKKMYGLPDASIATRIFFFGCDDVGARALPPFEVARP